MDILSTSGRPGSTLDLGLAVDVTTVLNSADQILRGLFLDVVQILNSAALTKSAGLLVPQDVILVVAVGRNLNHTALIAVKSFLIAKDIVITTETDAITNVIAVLIMNIIEKTDLVDIAMVLLMKKDGTMIYFGDAINPSHTILDLVGDMVVETTAYQKDIITDLDRLGPMELILGPNVIQ